MKEEGRHVMKNKEVTTFQANASQHGANTITEQDTGQLPDGNCYIENGC